MQQTKWLKQRTFHDFVARKCKVKAPAHSASGDSFLPGLQTVTFTLRPPWQREWSLSSPVLLLDWLDLPTVQETLKSLLQHHSSKASILQRSAFFTVQLSHPYMTTGKTIALTLPLYKSKSWVTSSSDGKESACNAGDVGSIWVGKIPRGGGIATHFSIRTWGIPWSEELAWYSL